MATDTARGRVVLFSGNGGADETWEWDGTDWVEMLPTVSPG